MALVAFLSSQPNSRFNPCWFSELGILLRLRLSFWFRSHFNASPLDVFSRPFDFSADVLPPFYAAFLRAWHAFRGCSSASCLVVASTCASPLSADAISCKVCYQSLLSLNPCVPHCVSKCVSGGLVFYLAVSFLPAFR